MKVLDLIGGARTIGPLGGSEVPKWLYMTIMAGGADSVAEERTAGDAKDGRRRRSIGDMHWNRFLAILLGLIGVLAVGITITLLQLDEGSRNASVDPVPAAAAPLPPSDRASALPSQSLPPVPSSVALVGPSADSTVASAFASEAEKLRDELSEHNVPFTEADVAAIIVIGEEAVARNVPDLRADDPTITERVSESFPHYTRQQRKDVVRCVAEQAEQVIARQTGDGVPPDQRGRTGG